MRRLVVLIVLAGCVTPSIPIPPPEPSKMDFHLSATGVDSTAVFNYRPTSQYKGGIAYLYNQTVGLGIIQNCNADGSIGPTVPMKAKLADQIIVSVQV